MADGTLTPNFPGPGPTAQLCHVSDLNRGVEQGVECENEHSGDDQPMTTPSASHSRETKDEEKSQPAVLRTPFGAKGGGATGEKVPRGHERLSYQTAVVQIAGGAQASEAARCSPIRLGWLLEGA
jgi:hypothetical protein